MINLKRLRLSAIVNPLVGLAASASIISTALTFDSQRVHADVQALTVSYAPMQPVIQTEPALPKPRPDPALAYDLQPVDITLPVSKPALKDILPISTATLSETIKTQTGFDTVYET